MKDKHKYRLTFNSPNPGFFRFDEASLTFKLDEYSEIEIKARDAGKLVDATKFHIESGGFLDKASAISFTGIPLLNLFKISAVLFSKTKYSLLFSNQTIVLSSTVLYKKFDCFFIKNKSNFFIIYKKQKTLKT